MLNYLVTPSTLKGSLIVPPSKSHTLRAILFAALAKGTSRIEQFLPSPDTTAMIEAVRQLGAEVKIVKNALEICGFKGNPKPAKDVIDCGNSGQVLRFIGALSALLPHYTILTGDASIRENRPLKPLLEGLHQLGAFTVSSRNNGYAPVIIKGPLTKKSATLDGQDSQPVSGLLIAGAFATHPIELHVIDPGEKPWIELTLNWFQKLGILYQRQGYTYYRMQGNAKIESFNYTVPGDFSTAAFPIAAALLTNSELTLYNLDRTDCQGDKIIISILQQMGARFVIDTQKHTLVVQKGATLKGITIDINDCIDALPILAVIGCFCEGRTDIVNAAIARNKESDRIHSMAHELRKMGACLEEHPDGLTIYPSKLHGAKLTTYNDHRIALSLTIAALGAQTPSKIHNVGCIAKTYPQFYEAFTEIGARIER
jgi:3-phosphoshikimate 1-carboxyvinyltransferase